jgi:hypothetical protein
MSTKFVFVAQVTDQAKKLSGITLFEVAKTKADGLPEAKTLLEKIVAHPEESFDDPVVGVRIVDEVSWQELVGAAGISASSNKSSICKANPDNTLVAFFEETVSAYL